MCKLKWLNEALQGVDLMFKSVTLMSKHTVCCLLQELTSKKDLIAARRLHSIMFSNGVDAVPIIGDYFIRLFAKCGSLLEANLIFSMITKPSVYTWHAIMSAHVMLGESDRALNLYHRMQEECVRPNRFVITCILKASGNIQDLGQGQLIHDDVIKNGHASHLIISSSLVDMYAKCGNLEEARKVFDESPKRDIVLWSAMLSGYVQNGSGFSALKLLDEMQQMGTKPDKVMFLLALKACGCIGSLELHKLLHVQIVKSGIESDVVIGNTLCDMYAKYGSLEESRTVFDLLQNRSVVSWGSVMAGLADHGHGVSVLELFEEMECKHVKPNKVIFLCSLKACRSIGAIEQGRLLHHQIIKGGLHLDVAIGSTLTDMYAKCGTLEDAYGVFDKLPKRNVVSWGAMIAAYVQHGHSPVALELYQRMQQECITPAKLTYLVILKAFADTGILKQGRHMHDQIVRSGYESDEDIDNTLLDMYAKCRSLEDARKLFENLQYRSVVSWSAMIAGYMHHGDGLLALELFDRMQQEGIKPDRVSFLCILKACGSIGVLKQGKLIHREITRSGFERDMTLGNALIEMYAKCWCLEWACKVFEELPTQDIVTWGTIIAGYAQHGDTRLAAQCLEAIQQGGLKPNSVIYTSLLLACNQAGRVGEGGHYFKSMTEVHGIRPSVEHYNCMIDLLGGAGDLKEAEQLLKSMPNWGNNVIGCMSLLTACRTYGNVEIGRKYFDQIVSVDPSFAAVYVFMANIYADADMWKDAHKVLQMRKYACALKMPGRAWIQFEKRVHEFVVGDKASSLTEKIHADLKRLVKSLKQEGYAPQVDLELESTF